MVRVRACALNRLDVLQRRAPVVPTFRLPHIAGMDVVGEVVSVGEEVPATALGARVVLDPVVVCERCDRCVAGLPMYCRELRTVGSSRDGGFADLVAAPWRNCIPVPEGALDDAELASVPVASVTAWHAITGPGAVRAGEVVVVPAAGSGVGAAGIQIAKNLGATVITTVGDPGKIAAAEALGADAVIDRTAGPWWERAVELTDGRGVDVVIDHVGGEFVQQAIDALRIEGRIVMSGTTAGSEAAFRGTSLFHWGKRILGHGGYRPAEMRAVVEEYLAGRLRAVVDGVWGFEALPEAEERLESGRFNGKLVLSMEAA
ncbi:zinc-binding dehydrogenase [Galbitalea sp. SE-J8]|uniref:zinc-binding dehydrogenase n=1 Tax=Galbitalea sp. SE-J8 TaxID=3054952 RepID=UPI00259CB272|nr:zinc-binding dehydrogenase [Galbitalea sp. SE-J8]MDM4764065.1 zinc-binding dehydrogenase [Galbitalea sp. SE-J8]